MSTQTITNLEAGITNVSIDVSLVQGAASSNPGEPISGLAFDTPGLTCYYRRGGTGTVTQLPLVTQTADSPSHVDGGFAEISAANMPGQFRLDLSDAIVADGEEVITVTIAGAANLTPHTVYIYPVESISVDQIVSNGPINTSGGAVSTVTNCVNNSDMRGTDNALLASSYTAPDNTGIADNGQGIATIGVTLGSLNNLSEAQVNAQVTSALEDIRLDELLSSPLGVQPQAGSLLGNLTEDNNGVQRFTAAALAEAPTGGGGGSDNSEIANGTAQSLTATSIQLAASETFGDEDIRGATVVITGGSSGVGQSRLITSYTGGSNTATVDAWTVTPTGTVTYAIFATPPASPSAPVPVSLEAILGEVIAESSVGRLANNFEFFYNNGDTQTSKIVEDVGSGGGGGGSDWTSTERNQIRFRLGVDGAASTPSASADLSTQSSVDGLSTTLSSVSSTLDDVLLDTGTFIPASQTTISDQINALNDVAAGDIVNGGPINTSGGAVLNVDTCANNSDMRGTDGAATASALNSVSNDIDDVKDVTDQMVFTKSNELDVNTRSINGAGIVGNGDSVPFDGE